MAGARIRKLTRTASELVTGTLLLTGALTGTASADPVTARPATGPAATAATGTQAAATASSATSKKPASAKRSRRSGLAWSSGVYMPGGQPRVYDRFGAWRRHRIDVAVMWTPRQTWADMVDPAWLYRTWAGTPETKVIGLPPIPEGGNSTLGGCARGAYNWKWATFARHIKAAGMDDQTIIRLGWEFNGDWYKWSARNPRQFAGCWRQVVSSAERVAPALRWDWTVNRGAGQSVTDARKAWPGNKYVDIVGVDAYDMWPGATSAAGWNTQLNGRYGLKFWRDFARAHHKKLSVPEWGVYPGSAHAGHNGGDNAYYIQKMNSFFRANASIIAYEAYFNESAPYFKGSLFGPNQNPRAAAAYRAAF